MKIIIALPLLFCASLFAIIPVHAATVDFSGIYVYQAYGSSDYLTVHRNGDVYLAIDISRNTSPLVALAFMTRTDTQQPPLEEFAVVLTDSIPTPDGGTAFRTIYPLVPFPRTTMVKDMMDSPLYGASPSRRAWFEKHADGEILFCLASTFGDYQPLEGSLCYTKIF